MLLQTFVCRFFLEHKFPFLWGMHVEWDCWVMWSVSFNVKCLYHSAFPPSVSESFSCSPALSALGVVSFIWFGPSPKCAAVMVVLGRKGCLFSLGVCKLSYQVPVGSVRRGGLWMWLYRDTLSSPRCPLSPWGGERRPGWLLKWSVAVGNSEGWCLGAGSSMPLQCVLAGCLQNRSSPPSPTFSPSGLHTNHFRGALLWWVWDERQGNLLWEEFQSAEVHVHHPLHPRGAAAGRAAWAVPAEYRADHHARLSLHQDPHQRHPEGGGMAPAGDRLWPEAATKWVGNISLLHGRLECNLTRDTLEISF